MFSRIEVYLPSRLSAAWRLPSVLLTACLAWASVIVPAHAVPSFSRQTGSTCADCHVGSFGPQLTPFGMTFKLNGYTLTNGGEGHIPLSAMVQSSYEKLNTAPADGSKQHTAEFAQQASLFLAGRMTDHIGAFIQATGTGEHGTFKVPTLAQDNADIRYADTFTLGGKSSVVGVSLNNNPTVSDVFNTVPAWRFPYIGPTLTPGANASPLLDGGLGAQVWGLNAYTLVDNTWYAELGGYMPQSRSFLESTNVLAPGDPYNKLSGVNPYWRFAYMGNVGGGTVTAGVFGLNARITPDGLTAKDKYNDIGVDGSYQLPVGKNDILAVNGAYMHEKQTLDATFANAGSDNASNTLHRFDLSASYYFDQTYGLTLGTSRIGGTSDTTLYGGDPTTNSYILQADWTPFGKAGSWGSPWANVRLGLQYTWFTKLNGLTNSDNGGGPKASDSNTLYAFVWTSF
ncbi:MAG: cytochrome C [Parasulfuritortus sp.]|nr:cytochrome C [Parasulfuritortus sp.]